jgi:molybdate transport system substrate-binding protein
MEPIHIQAAGSLRTVLGKLCTTFMHETGHQISSAFGASGLLRQKIEAGDRFDVFMSADMDHPRALAVGGLAEEPRAFITNSLCLLLAPGVTIKTEDIVETLHASHTRIGISTPQADPSGDYALDFFDKIDRLRPGSYAQLSARARRLTGAPDIEKPDIAGSVYAWHLARGDADVFITYRTNGLIAQAENPRITMIEMPDALAVTAQYGVTLAKEADGRARAFCAFLAGATAMKIFARHGFQTPSSPMTS